MTIPDFQSVIRPALDILSDDRVRTLGELRDLVAERMGVTAEEREVLLPNGTQRTFDNRVGWAMSHLAAVGAVSRPSRWNYQITARGHQLLDELERWRGAPPSWNKRPLPGFLKDATDK